MENGTTVLIFLAAVWIVGACGHFAYDNMRTKHAMETASDTDKKNYSDRKK